MVSKNAIELGYGLMVIQGIGLVLLQGFFGELHPVGCCADTIIVGAVDESANFGQGLLLVKAAGMPALQDRLCAIHQLLCFAHFKPYLFFGH